MTVYAFLLMLHILGAVVWVGGALFQVLVIGPTLKQAGPSGMGFAQTLAKRGGIGKYFAVSGGLTIVLGAALYGQNEHLRNNAFDAASGNLYISLGAVLAVLGYLHGMMANLPTERKWIQLANSISGTPTPEQGKGMAELGAKLGKNGAISVLIVSLALVLMLLRRVVAS